jgi:hypothetical protein
MKKIFLLFGIAAVSSASAQQKDVFDMNRHIQGVLKNKNSSGTGGKIFEADNIYRNKLSQSQPKLSHILPIGDKVYILSRDNMPCVVPDMGQFTSMPNISNPKEYFSSPLFKNNTPGSMPNALQPYRLIDSK